MKYDVCIIGGGAAGMAAAASLNEQLNICIVDKNKILGRKVMATGGGRCNITNTSCSGYEQTLGFFASLGLEIYADEEGRCYPYSNRAADVTAILQRGIKAKADIKTETAVTGLTKKKDYIINTDKGDIEACSVILAAGGKAAPQFGTIGDGYKLAGSLGHTVTRTYPILTGIECLPGKEEKKLFAGLKGIRAKASVSLLKNGEPVTDKNGNAVTEHGELQFTEYGISGICVFNLTPYITAGPGENFRDAVRSFSVSVDFAPDIAAEKVLSRKDSFGILTEKLAEVVDVKEIKDWRLPVTGVRGWRDAQCTAGGISTGEIDPETMESKFSDRLYIAGEILDMQGPCGGYNLQIAWETGIKAAEAINKEFVK